MNHSRGEKTRRTSARRKRLMLFSVLLVGSSEEFFFEYPKKALTEFFQSLKTKKQPPKTNVQHYHVYYYPVPIPLLGWTKAPNKQDLDKLYEDTTRSFGWSNYYYKYSPNPSIIVSSDLQLWDDSDLWDQEFAESDTIDRDSRGILVQVPVNQQFSFHLLKKLRRETIT